jgi:hypothetical protein
MTPKILFMSLSKVVLKMDQTIPTSVLIGHVFWKKADRRMEVMKLMGIVRFFEMHQKDSENFTGFGETNSAFMIPYYLLIFGR